MNTRWRWMALAMIGLALPASGCGADPSSAPSMPGGGMPDGGEPGAPPPGNTAVSLPFTVSDYFFPSGFMGDGQTSPTAVVVSSTACQRPRPTGAVGDCYRVTFTPGDLGWAGVYWQYPENNWGASPGKPVEAGASRVTFYAAGAAGGEMLQLLIGGESNAKLPYQDSFKATSMITLTTTPMLYEVDISGRNYDSGVLGAFGWTLIAPTGAKAPIVFFLDSIRWEK